MKKKKLKIRSWLRQLGPGLVTGAADDDPSGIATYSQAGAKFGYELGWTVVLTYPLMVAVQIISASLGRVTGRGLADNIRENFPAPVLYALVIMLLVANTINVAADVAAMGQSLQLVVGGPVHLYAVGFGVVCLALEIYLPYRRYVTYLKWLTLVLFAYVAVALAANVSWSAVLSGIVWPRVPRSSDMLTVIVAVFGTTISPYLFFWQAALEVEEVEANPKAHALKQSPSQAPSQLRRIDIDTYVGMGLSNAIALFIIIATAATLHQSGTLDIETSAQAAEALRPIAGPLAFLLFSLGIIGTGMLAIPVLAGSAAYAVAETFKWRRGLDRKPREARGFYAIVALATLGGTALTFSPIDPIRALFWSAVINGVISVPVLIVMMLLAGNVNVMGKFVSSPRLKFVGWLATAVMAAAVCAMFFATD
ncbi:MAG: divalent metal cation transporter [Betaproteobacteria bacterium]|nr:MAG: divalent metal cation transporter [Betaproteobacteria bacterium]